MNDPQPSKKRFPWLLVAVPPMLVLYWLSFGPACWMLPRNEHRGSRIVHVVYAPLLWLGSYGPQRVRDYIAGYANRRAHPYAVQIHKGNLYYRHWLSSPSHLD